MTKDNGRLLAALARKGRGGDTEIGHLTEGELVVPVAILARFPEARDALFDAFREAGIDPDRYIVGEEENSVNPETGVPEFGDFSQGPKSQDATGGDGRGGFGIGNEGGGDDRPFRPAPPPPPKLAAEFADFITEDGRRLEDVLGKSFFKPFVKDEARERVRAERRTQAKRLNQTKSILTGARGVSGPANTAKSRLTGG